MGGKAPDAPDLGPMAEGSMETARMAQQTAREQLDWAKEQDTANRGLLDRVLTGQQRVQDQTLQNAQDDRSRYENVYQPLENNLVSEFQNYDTPERRQEERGRGIADVNTSFDAARRNSLQRLESYGIDPSQTRNAALDLGTRVQQAQAQAGAAAASDRATEQTGRALRAEAINIGKGLPSNVAASYGQSLQAGNSMVGNANQTTSTGAGAMGAGNAAMNTAIGGYGQAGNTASQGYANQMQQYNANQAQTTGILGAVGGMAGMMMADGGTPEDDEAEASDNPTEEFAESQPGAIDFGKSDGSGIDDQVPIMASKDEYIIPADVVRAKGVEFFDKLVDRYHTPAQQQREDMHTQNIRSGAAVNPTPKANGGMAGYGGPQQIPMSAPKPAPMASGPQPIRHPGGTPLRLPQRPIQQIAQRVVQPRMALPMRQV